METQALYRYEEAALATEASRGEVVKASRPWVQRYLAECEVTEHCGSLVLWGASESPTPAMPGEAVGVRGRRAIHRFLRMLRVGGARFQVHDEPGPRQVVEWCLAVRSPRVIRERPVVGSKVPPQRGSDTALGASAQLAPPIDQGDAVVVRGGVLLTRSWAEGLDAAQERTLYHYGSSGSRRRIPFGAECYPTERLYRSGVAIERRPCLYCAASPGEFHEPLCPNEQCPICDGWLVCCDCHHPEVTTQPIDV